MRPRSAGPSDYDRISRQGTIGIITGDGGLTLFGSHRSKVRGLGLTAFAEWLLVAGMSAPATASPVPAAPDKASASIAALCSATIPRNISPGLRLLQPTQGINQPERPAP